MRFTSVPNPVDLLHIRRAGTHRNAYIYWLNTCRKPGKPCVRCLSVDSRPSVQGRARLQTSSCPAGQSSPHKHRGLHVTEMRVEPDCTEGLINQWKNLFLSLLLVIQDDSPTRKATGGPNRPLVPGFPVSRLSKCFIGTVQYLVI